MKKKENGFTVIIAVLIVLVVLVVGAVGWRVLNNNNDKDVKTSSTSAKDMARDSAADEKEAAWNKYVNEDAGLTFKYPDGWKNEINDTSRVDDGEFWGVNGSVISPSGKQLAWVFQIAGGKGGDCVPLDRDVAFSDGNKCSSKDIISVEKAHSIKPPTGKTFRNLYADSLYITRTKYLSSSPGSSVTYQICLDPYYTSNTETHNNETPMPGASMGLLFPCNYWSTGFNAKFEVDSEAEFTSAEAKTAEAIMKTFDSL